MYENEKLEFKTVVTDEIYKGVIAFANTGGGVILIGVDQAGEVAPLADLDDEYIRLTNGIRDAIMPDVTKFAKYTLEKSGVIRVEISEGPFKPYYLKAKGLKPSGVYIRQGVSSVPASQEQIRQMIKNADGDQYEEMRSREQDLTFVECARVFKANGVPFDARKYSALGIHGPSAGQYTNLALLLSDQCAHTIKVAVFADQEHTIFRDHREFTGSVMKQAEEVFGYLQLNNKNRSVMKGLAREDYWDYPQDAVRE